MAQKFKPTDPVKTAATASSASAGAAKATAPAQPVQFIFDKNNYRMLIISVAVVAFGFVLMSGTTDIYSTTKIVIAPIVVLGGFALGFFAILKKPSAN
jgi:type IV secretory pathway VirB2 component (pilin)